MPPVNPYSLTIIKHARELHVYRERRLVHCHPVALGRNADVDKRIEGDEATPVGEFYICAKNPRSKYFLSLCLSYPHAAAAERGLREGLIGAEEHRLILDALVERRMPPQHTALGGEIYIHGEPAERRAATRDWTHGCIALENRLMAALYAAVALGTPVLIEP